jgi:5'-3' exonuclease
MLDYTRDDFDLLELQMLRQMFQIQFRKFADRESFDARHDPSRIIDDFVFMVCVQAIDLLLKIDGHAHIDLHLLVYASGK